MYAVLFSSSYHIAQSLTPSFDVHYIIHCQVLVEIVSDLGRMAQLGQRLDAANKETKGAESSIVSEIFGLLDQSKVGHTAHCVCKALCTCVNRSHT